MTNYQFYTLQDNIEAERLQAIIKDGGAFASLLGHQDWHKEFCDQPGYYFITRPNYKILTDAAGVPLACIHNLYSRFPGMLSNALVVSDDFDNSNAAALTDFINHYDANDELADITDRGDWSDYTAGNRLANLIKQDKRLRTMAASVTVVDEIDL